MRKMFFKEWKLALHPTNWLFLFLSVMLLIPNYPYYVVFFYTTLGLFFTCLTGRENRDVEYTALLPVKKCMLVKGRYAFAAALEILQVLSALPFVVLKQTVLVQPNLAGMDANIAFLGLGLVLFGLFNAIFFPQYYRAPEKVGRAFLFASAGMCIGIGIFEIMAHAVPFFVNCLDTPDPAFWPQKLAVLVLGSLIFLTLNAFSMKKSIHFFEKLDL